MDLLLFAIPLLISALITAAVWAFGQPISPSILPYCVERMNARQQLWSSRQHRALEDAKTLVQTFRSSKSLLLYPTDDQVQRLARALALAFFKFTIDDRVNVVFTPMPNVYSSIRRLPDGKVDILIHDSRHILSGLSFTTSLVSLLLRELCVTFTMLEAGETIGGFSLGRQWWLLGETGYGLGWLELAGTVHFRATTRLGISDLNLEMKRKVRTEYIRSGLQPSKSQINRFFDGEDPLIADDGVHHIQCNKKSMFTDRGWMTTIGVGAGIVSLAVAFGLKAMLV